MNLRTHKDAVCPPLPSGDLWVFAYGSLMWNPGFPFLDCQPALLHGYHRSLCVWSHVHRGTPKQPGMVLGLDRGGSCRGYVFRVQCTEKDQVANYLYAREMPTTIYQARFHPVRIEGRQLNALTFVVDRAHAQYAGKVPAQRAATFIRQAKGVSGHSQDYLRSTLAHLQQLGIHDRHLLDIAAQLDRMSTEKKID